MEDFIRELHETTTADLLLILKDQADLYSREEIKQIHEELETRGIDYTTLRGSLNHPQTDDPAIEDGNAEEAEIEEEESEYDDTFTYSTASGEDLPYVVIQVTLKEKLWGTGSKNLTDLEMVINRQVSKGYRLHTMTTSNGGSKGPVGGDRIQATLVFEKVDLFK